MSSKSQLQRSRTYMHMRTKAVSDHGDAWVFSPRLLFNLCMAFCVVPFMVVELIQETIYDDQVWEEAQKLAMLEKSDIASEMHFKAIDTILGAVHFRNIMATLFFMCSMLVFFGLLWNSQFHPRTGLLVRTIAEAADHLAHFFLIFLVVFVLFAFFGFSFFGRRFEAYSTFTATMETQFKFLLGSHPGDMGEKHQKLACIVYQGAFVIVVMCMLLNFFLAIVVNQFTVEAERVQRMPAEQNTLVDILALMLEPWRLRWTREEKRAMGLTLDKWIRSHDDYILDEGDLLSIFDNDREVWKPVADEHMSDEEKAWTDGKVTITEAMIKNFFEYYNSQYPFLRISETDAPRETCDTLMEFLQTSKTQNLASTTATVSSLP
eukprot:gnl/MRDRNA2_/MRDRNA2_72451_c0_seq2.p1 gnl/MRDRNA2_/MRDRNA2_72451_c0~~gnl/MRDRNA2_/MRDRNA2_72451_c0_seq2.p1  ORF type:complete len:440 (-),score=73.25 gnl/MRDRNA2_/MRDRNA2_72451_c0_seq2:208-1338(-)